LIMLFIPSQPQKEPLLLHQPPDKHVNSSFKYKVKHISHFMSQTWL
jgi:hypothetical protein